MASDKYSKRRLRSSAATTVVSISLVLFMLGLLGLLILNARKVSTHVKESIGFQIILKDNISEEDVTSLDGEMKTAPYIKSLEFISKEDAAKKLTEDLGEDFISFLGFNPLLPSYNIHLKADYANTDSIANIEQQLMKKKQIREVVYQKSLVNMVNENIRRISLVILAISALLMLIALALINNTISLTIYSKRFLIKTMQLVGATQFFIRKPFILKGIKHGIYGAVMAILMLLTVLYFTIREYPDLQELQSIETLLILFGIVLLLGIMIGWISTSLAVRKYLRLKTDELYY
jgi:cell division transport system permease protein